MPKGELSMSATAQSTSDRVAKIEPILRAHAAQAEIERRLAPQAMAALHDAGIMRTWVPKAYGGLQMNPVPALKMFEEISRIDSAAGWIASNSSIIAFFCQVISDQGAAEMFSDPQTVVAGGGVPPHQDVPDQERVRPPGRRRLWCRARSDGCRRARVLGLCGRRRRLGSEAERRSPSTLCS